MSISTPMATDQRRYRILFAVAQGLALLLGGFTLLNIAGELRNPGFDANLWWIDLRFANRTLNRLLLLSLAVGLLGFALRPQLAPCKGWLLSSLLAVLIVIAAMNAWVFRQLLSSGVIQSSFGVPLSAIVVITLILIVWGCHSSIRFSTRSWQDLACYLLTLAIGLLLFPLAQMYCFGKTDYRRPADLIVVFGCKVFSDGEPSMALSDRVKTGVELYHAGLAPRLLFSGGPGTGEIDETAAMRNLAMELGVPDEAIIRDPEGLNTQATVHNLVAANGDAARPRVLAVSNFYHLPRIKLCFRRAGWEVWTVPAKESRRLYYQERFLLREVAALWWYYLNPS
jgi:uncharacterized SAM-binding protein YcdF (DUF218 family)